MTSVIEPPQSSILKAPYGGGSYQDCFMEKADPQQDLRPVALFLKVMYPMPWWVNSLMAVRNFVVGFFGLKNEMDGISETKKAEEYQVGDYISFFKITHLSDDEIVVTANDRHLDSSFSLFVEKEEEMAKVYLTSIVQTKEKLGDVYMFVIAPFHRIIVKSTLKKVRSALK
ncbi:MAG: DUF2867 domain-containing protein [Sneathiellales bacterium]|nr:DUF2867 domain-containing protein [Sneathiellales bacterium]